MPQVVVTRATLEMTSAYLEGTAAWDRMTPLPLMTWSAESTSAAKHSNANFQNTSNSKKATSLENVLKKKQMLQNVP
jgi:glucan phosphoethanolaminetransferase (alkaline phosphatase superfamily)